MGVGWRIAGFPPKEGFFVGRIFWKLGGLGIVADGIGLTGENDEVVGFSPGEAK